jgi:hypothetical protein
VACTRRIPGGDSQMTGVARHCVIA